MLTPTTAGDHFDFFTDHRTADRLLGILPPRDGVACPVCVDHASRRTPSTVEG